jgi:peptidoglycan hydrolase-like protein with peptidoglycan-binding domain
MALHSSADECRPHRAHSAPFSGHDQRVAGDEFRGSVLSLFALAVALIAVATAAGAPSKSRVPVFFLRGEQLSGVTRPGATPAAALHQLLAGPTPAEIRRGLRTYVPAGTQVRSVKVANGLATVDLARFASGTDVNSRLGGSRSSAHPTASEAPSRSSPIDGRTVRASSRYFTSCRSRSGTCRHPKAGPIRRGSSSCRLTITWGCSATVDRARLLRDKADGRLGPVTRNGILAFQKWERLQRTGSLDAQTETRLLTAARPAPVTRGSSGKRAEILLDRQVALLIKDTRVLRTIAVSTGKPSTPTPPEATASTQRSAAGG